MISLLTFVIGIVVGILGLTLYQIFGRPAIPPVGDDEWRSEYPAVKPRDGYRAALDDTRPTKVGRDD
jgi:heme A synthase